MTTDEFRLYHEQTFDSFSKRVIRHIAIDIHNAEAALSKVEVSLSTLPYSEAAKLAAEDTYDLGDDVCVRFDCQRRKEKYRKRRPENDPNARMQRRFSTPEIHTPVSCPPEVQPGKPAGRLP